MSKHIDLATITLAKGNHDCRDPQRCLFEWWNYFAGFEDRIPGWLDSEVSADCDPGWGICVGAYIGPDSFET